MEQINTLIATNTFQCNGITVVPGDELPEHSDSQRKHYLQRGWAVEQLKKADETPPNKEPSTSKKPPKKISDPDV